MFNSKSTPPLLIRYFECPAKTYNDPMGNTIVGRSVLNHCQIVGEVARQFIARVPSGIREALFPCGAELAAACHDIGKVSPYFYEKIRQACTVELTKLPPLENINPKLEKEWGGHAGVSQLTVKAINAPKYIPEILGQHHGFAPSIEGKRANDAIFGGQAWQEQREALVIELKATLGVDWPLVDSVPQARLLAGLTSVSDWIGSGHFFENPQAPWKENIERALDEAGFTPPTYRQGLSFEQMFSFRPHTVQQELIAQVVRPGVYVLEAPMGLGKTEAALYAAYRMLESGQASGIYFALPTQLTSNKIFERFNAFLDRALSDDCQHRSLLLHSTAWLLDTNMGEEGKPGGAWFNNAKRGLLAPFAVGTIDQALMAAMNVKHGFVRAFGLASKVVILDEVHTYDAYTGTIMDALVELLRSLHCTVIILSATLNHDRREQILNSKLTSDAYPLITAAPNNGTIVELAVPIPGGQEVAVRLLKQESFAIEEVLRRAEEGQQILWIENTVLEAQQRYLELAARAYELGVDVGLLHSRYTQDDRLALEDNWVNQFGKAGWKNRPKRGRILVGTQVLEQSLDIDADFMISRFAPTDMLLQRLGRLWRHKNTPRPSAAVCEAWFLAPVMEEAITNPEKAFGNSAFVYSAYVLCRSLEVWRALQKIKLPTYIRGLIEQTYETRQENQNMARLLADLDHGTGWRKGRNDMRQLACITLSNIGNTLPENKSQTRYSETDSFDVLLLRQIKMIPADKISQLTLLNGENHLLTWQRRQLNKAQWRKLSATLMRQVVSLRVQDAPMKLPLQLL